MLPQLAFMCLYGDLEGEVTIVKPCDSAFVPVPSAAPMARRPWHTYGTSRSPFRTESIGEHLGVVTGIGADIANAMSAVAGPRPVA